MSANVRLKEAYEDTKRIYKSDTAPISKFAKDEDLLKCKTDITILKAQIDDLKSIVKQLQSLDMDGFLKKHENMKKSYNELVVDHNVTKVDIKDILDEIHKRVDTLEKFIL